MAENKNSIKDKLINALIELITGTILIIINKIIG